MAMDNISIVTGVTQNVHVDKNGKVDKEDADLFKSKHDQLEWSSEIGATITFGSATNSPFSDWEFPVRAGESVSSGPIRDNAEPRSYPYTVKAAGRQEDPTVIIHN